MTDNHSKKLSLTNNKAYIIGCINIRNIYSDATVTTFVVMVFYSSFSLLDRCYFDMQRIVVVTTFNGLRTSCNK